MTPDALLTELAAVARALQGAVEPPGADQLLSSLAETARRLFGAQACSLALLSEDATELVYTTAAGIGAGGVTGLRLPVTRGIAGWVVQSGQPVAVSEVRTDPRFAPDAARATGYVPEHILAAPVVSQDEVLGVLSVLDRDTARPDAEDDLALLQVFCAQAAIALETARSFRRVADVLLDALAGAAGAGTGLAEQLPPGDDDLLATASLLARLGRQDADARRVAVRVVTEVLDLVERRGTSRPGA